MTNVLSRPHQELVIRCLVEGASVRATERISSVHRDTILRLMVRMGEGCQRIMDHEMRDLACQRIQVDEIWSFVGKKQRRLNAHDDPTKTGDMWTFVAIDADSKLIPCYRVGKRTGREGQAFIADLESRLSNRVQLSSDALAAYVEAVERAFGNNVDYGQVVKSYEAEPIGLVGIRHLAWSRSSGRESPVTPLTPISQRPTWSARISRCGCRCAGSPG